MSLGVTPFLYGIYAITIGMYARHVDAPLIWQFAIPLVVLIALPCIGFAALKFGEAGFDVLKWVLR